jgi:multidrug efflux pump subunit AcrA (membrane-fusion protein)
LLLNPGGLKKLEKKGRPHEAWEITVSVNGGIKSYAWKGKFLRIASGIDTATRMLKMVIGVSDPYKKDKGSMKPPLDRGLFCSVEIKGRTARNLLVVPRYAIHEGRLYIANKDSRLEIRPVKTGFNIEQHTVIELGLKPGETVIVSDIVPAVSGMKLKVKMDQELMEKAKRELSGNGAKDD